jgi:hypothetical protein
MRLYRLHLGRDAKRGFYEHPAHPATKYFVDDSAFQIWLDTCASSVFDGFTVTETTGYWKGQKESSFVFEVLETEYKADTTKKVDYLRRSYIRWFNQDDVLVYVLEVDAPLWAAGS